MKIKIAMIGWEYPPYIVGGLGKHCYNLVNELLKLGHEIYFFSPSFFGEKSYDKGNFHMIKIPGVTNGRIYSHYSMNDNIGPYGGKIAKIIDELKPDIVHGHDWISVDALKRAKSLGYKIVFTLHSLDYMRSGFPTSISSIEKEGCKIADRVITVSNWMKNEIVKRYEIKNDKIIVIYNGVGEIPYDFNEEELEKKRNELGNFILFVGRLTLQKGPEYLIYAGKLLNDVDIVFAGRGDIPQLKSFSQSMNVNAKFLGFVSEKEKFLLYKSAEIFVSPSLYEPFGITIGEALKSGTAVISTQAGITELLEDGKDYLLFKKRDADDLAMKIRMLMEDEKLRNKLKSNGPKAAKDITWKKCAHETMNVYKSI